MDNLDEGATNHDHKMAAPIPGSLTRVLFDTGQVHHKVIRTFKNTVCFVFGGSNVYLNDRSNEGRRTDPIEWETLKLLCHDYIIDLFFCEKGIIYLCEHGCIHRYDATMKNTRLLQPLSPRNPTLSIHPTTTGLYIIVSSNEKTQEWTINIRSLTSLSKHPILIFTRNKLTTDDLNTPDRKLTLKPAVICLHSASFSSDDYYRNSVPMETNLFEQLFSESQSLPHLNKQSLLVGFPDGQVCSFKYGSSENGSLVAGTNCSNLICCLHSPIAGIFALNLNNLNSFCDCICVVGQNGKAIVFRLSAERPNSISLIEFYIPKPVLACDINRSTLIHCNGKHIYATELKTSGKCPDTIRSDVCSDLMGVSELKIIRQSNDESLVTVINTTDGRIMEADLNLNLKGKIEFKGEMASVFSDIERCSTTLVEMKLLEEKQTNVLSSLSTATTLVLSGKAADYFECRCVVHSCSIACCTLALSVRNNSPYKLNYGTWNISCIIKWPLNNLTGEKQNQIVKSQPLTTDLNQGEILTSFLTIPLDTVTNNWQFPLQVIPFFVVMDSRKEPGRPIATIQLHDFRVTELCLLETANQVFLPVENTLQRKVWKMAEQRTNFDRIFKKFPLDSRPTDSFFDILTVEKVKLHHLISLPSSNTDATTFETSWRGFKIVFTDEKDVNSTRIRLRCDDLGLLAKLRSSVIKKLKESTQEATGEIESITLSQQAIRSHYNVASLINSFYSVDIAQQLHCLMHLYYELRNKISSELPLIIKQDK